MTPVSGRASASLHIFDASVFAVSSVSSVATIATIAAMMATVVLVFVAIHFIIRPIDWIIRRVVFVVIRRVHRGLSPYITLTEYFLPNISLIPHHICSVLECNYKKYKIGVKLQKPQL